MRPVGKRSQQSARRDRRVRQSAQDAALLTTWWTEIGRWNNGSIAIAGQAVPVNSVSGVPALARRPNDLDVIYIGGDANLYAVSWSPSSGWGKSGEKGCREGGRETPQHKRSSANVEVDGQARIPLVDETKSLSDRA
jgi:hypothetical protein